jgi:ZIP family zinc transporter
VFLAAHKSSSIGLSLALAIALHNIPEGVAVALPVYFATGSRMKGFNTAAVSGLAEPLAVVLLAVVLPSGKLPHAWVEMVRGQRGVGKGKVDRAARAREG